MKKILTVFLVLVSISAFAQESQDHQHPCAWFQQLVESNDKGEQLNILKKFYREYTTISADDPCKIIVVGSLDDQYIMLARNTNFYHPYGDLYITELQIEDLDQLNFLDRKAAQTLWGAKGAVIFSSTSAFYKNRMHSIYRARNKN